MKPSEIAHDLRTLIELRMPFFLRGPVGVGKSAVVRQVTEKLGLQLTDVRLSQMDPTDLKGFPAPDLAAKTMHWLPANFLPPMFIKKGSKMVPNDTKGVLFLDEMNSAPPMVMAAAYQLLLDFRVGDYVLPSGWTIGGAGNREIDRGIVNRMPAPLANRLVHMDFEADLDDFTAWAMNHGLSPTTVAFLRFKPNLLHNFVHDSKEAAFPTPRSWHMADRITQATSSVSSLRRLLGGTVGEGAASEYLAFSTMMNQLPTVEQVALDPTNTPVPEAPGAQYATSTMLSMAAGTVSAWRSFMPYVERMPEEFQVVFMRDMLAKKDQVNVTPTAEYMKWAMAHKDVIL